MMDLPTVVDFQRDLKIYGGFTNFQISLCLYEFLYNSYTIELRACVNNIYSSFENIEHSEETYLYLVLSGIFQIKIDVFTPLKTTFTNSK